MLVPVNGVYQLSSRCSNLLCYILAARPIYNEVLERRYSTARAGKSQRQRYLLYYAHTTTMPKARGREHTTLTETAKRVVRELHACPGIKMIAPGEINTTSRRKSGKRHLTITKHTAGLQLIITGQSAQKVAVHTEDPEPIIIALKGAKSLREFIITVRN